MAAPQQNLDSLAGQGEFHSKRPADEPLTTKGHKPGVKVGNDAAPEFSAEVHEPGTAPSEDTYKPNPQSEIPGQAQNDDATVRTDPLDTLPGATSADVHRETQYGKPPVGETSAERHSAKAERRPGVGGRLGHGESAETGDGSAEGKARATGADLEGRAAELKGQRGASGATEGGLNWPGAESAHPVSAEHVAAERR